MVAGKKGKKADLSSEEVRQQIMSAALKHFALHGFQGASLKAIASDAKVAGSLINYHFKDKAGLFEACMEPFARGRMEALLRILAEPQSREDLRVRLTLFVDELIDGVLNNMESFEVVDREVRAGNPVILKIFENTMLKAFKGVIQFFGQAQSKGLISEEADPMILASLLFTSCCEVIRKEKLGQKFFNVSFRSQEWRQKFSANVVNLFMNGVVR